MTQNIDFDQYDYRYKLKQIVFNQHDLMQRLMYLRQINTEAYLSAGVIRNLVWSVLHGQHYKIENTEIDVIFYDLVDEHAEQQRLTGLLKHQFAENEWDVVNQAFVHRWYKTDQGQSIAQYSSLLDALSVWVETATAIAVRLLENGDLEIVAPFELNDLFELKLRWNNRLVSRDVFIQRVQSKRFLEKWQKLRIVETEEE
ncbi:nucleotidyltransferase family protein [Acinetobacter sp. P8-3-8]|uniref:nucleotidyltransferase family protein n=1 Tax=Acinetobacter sp. P8-3-8 TaxID=1029823 RepID=UPI0002486587|nr:nucleotidyltransferase family protein [Acinetobacter sp. P8-3-8]